MSEQRHLTIQEQRLLARALRSSSTLVNSFDLAPVDVNILPMQLVVDTETIDRCIENIQSEVRHGHVLSSVLIREIVLSVLNTLGTDIGRGHKADGESQTGGAPNPGPASGADHL